MSNAPEQSRRPGDPTASIGPEVLAAASHESAPVAIAEAIAPDVADGAATPSAVLAAAGALQEHAFVAVTNGNRLTRTERGDAVAFMRASPKRVATLYCHVHHGDAVPKRVADEWVEQIIGQPAAHLPGIGDRSVLGPYNPLGEFVGEGVPPDIRPTSNGHDLAMAMHNAWLDLVGRDRAWTRAKEVVGCGD